MGAEMKKAYFKYVGRILSCTPEILSTIVLANGLLGQFPH